MLKLSFAINPKLLATAGILLAVGSPAFANPDTVFLETGVGYGGSNPYQYYNGGEFTALTTGLPGSQVPNGYSPLATLVVGSTTGFETFCIEDGVDFSVGQTYNFTLGTAVQQNNSQLSAGVAWLYMEFATGQLAGYNYTNAAARLTDAGELQAAMWYLQGEPADGGDAFNGVGVSVEIPSPTWPQPHWEALEMRMAPGTSSTLFGVRVMELTNQSTGGIAQDQLIYVPDSGATLLLVGVSLCALALFKRRLKVA